MEKTGSEIDAQETERLRLVGFDIFGLLDGPDFCIEFPYSSDDQSKPSMLILAGKNGSGKTTILRMIAGLLIMDFDLFRRIPFRSCVLRLSDGTSMKVDYSKNTEFPLLISYGDMTCELSKKKGGPYNSEQSNAVNEMRKWLIPKLKQVDYELLDIHRSIALRSSDKDEEDLWYDPYQGAKPVRYTGAREKNPKNTLSTRVREFLIEAQINYRKFFAADELELLPRLIDRLDAGSNPVDTDELKRRVLNIQSKFSSMRRLGLQTDDADLRALAELLDDDKANSNNARVLVGAYVEMQEIRQKARELIAKRLFEFEQIMDEFLSEKEIRIDGRKGLRIVSKVGGELEETHLSSGEYHFLYMMVSALLCQRSGSIIAIDEPELSLHVTWQRKIVSALAKCAAGASPLFIFATHSPAIAAEHASSIFELTSLE